MRGGGDRGRGKERERNEESLHGHCRQPICSAAWSVDRASTFRTFVVDQLSRVVPQLRARAMFGGVGIQVPAEFLEDAEALRSWAEKTPCPFGRCLLRS